MDRNTGDHRRHVGGEAKGKGCSEWGMGSGGVRDMAFLGQDGVLSVAEVEEGDSHWCEEVKNSGWSLTGTMSNSGWWQLMNWRGKFCTPD